MSTRTITSFFRGLTGAPPSGARVDVELAGPALEEAFATQQVPGTALTVGNGIDATTGAWSATVYDTPTTGQLVRVRETINGAPVRSNDYEIAAGSTSLALSTLTPSEPLKPYTTRLTNEGHRTDRASTYYGHPDLQAQIDAIATGATDPGSEVAQARVDLDATTHGTLRDRLDSDATAARVTESEVEAARVDLAGVTQASLDARLDADAEFTQVGAGATVRQLRAKLEDAVSVKDFGAVGDGVTDDTAAIQAAIDSVSWRGGTVHVPAGRYVTSDTVGVRSRAKYYAKLGGTLNDVDVISMPLQAATTNLPGAAAFDADGGLLVIRDDTNGTNEIVRYEGVSGDNLTGLTRAQEGTTTYTFTAGRRVYALDAALTTLASDLTDSATTVTLANAADFPAEGGWVVIGLEVIIYTGKTGNTLTGLVRGNPAGGSAFVGGHTDSFAAAHSTGAGVWKFPHAVLIDAAEGATLVFSQTDRAAVAFHGEDWPCMLQDGGVRGLRVEGPDFPDPVPSTYNSRGIEILNGRRHLIQDCTAAKMRYGFRLWDRSWSNTLKDCFADYCIIGYYLSIQANSTLIEGCRALACRTFSLDSPEGVTNGVIRDCSFEFGRPVRIVGHGMTVDGCRFDTVYDQTALDPLVSATLITAALHLTGISGDSFYDKSLAHTASNNYFALDKQATYGIETNRVKNPVVSGNYLNGCKTYGIRLGVNTENPLVMYNKLLTVSDDPFTAASVNGVTNAATNLVYVANGSTGGLTDAGTGTTRIEAGAEAYFASVTVPTLLGVGSVSTDTATVLSLYGKRTTAGGNAHAVYAKRFNGGGSPGTDTAAYTITVPPSSGYDIITFLMAATTMFRTANTYNSGHLMVGTHHLWVDAQNRLRVKSGLSANTFPSSDVDGVGVQTTLNGATAARPATPEGGQMFFDTTLGKPIWYKASTTQWVDAAGTAV